MDEDGQVFYANTITGDSQWERPDDFELRAEEEVRFIAWICMDVGDNKSMCVFSCVRGWDREVYLSKAMHAQILISIFSFFFRIWTLLREKETENRQEAR